MSPPTGLLFTGKAESAALVVRTVIIAVFVLGLLSVATAGADDAVILSFKTRGSHTPGPGDSRALARKLALFRAKREAAEQAARIFVHRKLIQFVDRDKDELVCMVADNLSADVRQDQCRPGGDASVCTVQARTVVKLSDFIDAQLATLRLDADEETEDYRQEMEPRVPVPLQPGHALAKAYRLIDRRELRMTIIYLDRLAGRYPNWRELYEIKAKALSFQNSFSEKLDNLKKACELGSPAACAELKQGGAIVGEQ